MKQPMSEARRKALARAFPLRDARKEWNAIAQILEREGFRDDKGKPYSSGALKEAHSRLKGILPTEPGTLTHEAVNKMLETLETKLTTLIDDKLAKVGREKGPVPFNEEDRPKKPPKKGKKFLGSKSDLRAVVDTELFKRLEADSRAHFAGNLSATLDAVLWQFYGRPLLSFEVQNSQDE